MSRLLSTTRRVVVVALGLILVGYLAVGIYAEVSNSSGKRAAADDVERALPGDLAEVRERQARVVDDVAGEADPTWQWAEVVCEWGTNDAGWMVQDYVQECRVVAYNVFASATGRAGACESESWDGNEYGAALRSSEARGEWEECAAYTDETTYDGKRAVVDGERPSDVGPGPWHVVRTSKELPRAEIGCRTWLILCSEPGEVRLPDV